LPRVDECLTSMTLRVYGGEGTGLRYGQVICNDTTMKDTFIVAFLNNKDVTKGNIVFPKEIEDEQLNPGVDIYAGEIKPL